MLDRLMALFRGRTPPPRRGPTFAPIAAESPAPVAPVEPFVVAPPLEVEPLPEPVVPEPPAPAPRAEIAVHITERGDVWFSDSEWAGDAAVTPWIEGFIVKLDDGFDASEIACEAVAADGTRSAPVPGGALCGSRGRYTPLYGIAIRTTGALADQWHCEYSARFVDGSQAGPVRQGEVCRAPSEAALNAILIRFVPATEPDRIAA
jgi:hypothetical protein